MRKPNLFIVGAPKCGTTFLQVRLKEHPEVFMTTPKEPMFFASDIVDPYHDRLTKEDYLELYKNAGVEKKYWGEACVWNLQSKTAARNIKDMSPDAKIIIMLRNPYEAVISMFYQNQYGRAENAKSINEALNSEEKRINGGTLPPNCTPGNRVFYSYIMDFYPQVKRYFDVFDESQILVLFQEDLKKDSVAMLKRLYAFLEIDFIQQSVEKENTKRVNRFGWFRDLLESPPPIVSSITRKILNPQRRAALYNTLKKLNHAKVREEVISPSNLELLHQKWSVNIDLLSKLTGRPLSHWKPKQ